MWEVGNGFPDHYFFFLSIYEYQTECTVNEYDIVHPAHHTSLKYTVPIFCFSFADEKEKIKKIKNCGLFLWGGGHAISGQMKTFQCTLYLFFMDFVSFNETQQFVNLCIF